MTLCRSSLFGLGLLCVSACAAEKSSVSQHDTPETSPKARQSLDDAMFAVENAPPARVLTRSVDGKPRMLLGAKQSAQPAMMAALPMDDVAHAHLIHNAKALQLSPQTTRNVRVDGTHALPGGAQVVRFKQQVDGIEVFRGRASVVLDADKNMVSIASNLAPTWEGDARPAAAAGEGRYRLAPEAAVAHAYSSITGSKLSSNAVTLLERDAQAEGDQAEDTLRDYAVTAPDSSARVLSATAKRVLFPSESSLLPAYHVELLVRGPLPDANNAAFGYVINARDGRVLWQAPLTASDSFTYRVWADPAGNHTPTDGPFADFTPHPTGKPDGTSPAYVEPILVQMEGFNKNPQGQADPWLAPDAQFAWGNNVSAYSDRNNGLNDAGVAINNGFDEGADLRAELTGEKTFDRTYDVTRPPDADDNQIKAAITQIFYVTNWLHDYFYDSGFTEAAGNAQQNNYGRGGKEGDPLLAEAQDSANSGAGNNANMSTLSDGRSPRMQMYVWNGVANRTITTSPAITLDDDIGAASFGPEVFALGDTPVPLVLVNDGSTEIPPGGSGTMGTVSDGCQALTGLEGVIAVIDRGQCPFVDKVTSAQAAGARGVLLLNNAPGHAAPNPSASGTSISIPVLALSLEDGQKLKAALSAATAEQPVTALKFDRGAEVKHDGTIDNTVVAHEWGHYLHHRLVLCGQQSCGGMSEGFGDFSALMLTIREGDQVIDTAFPLSQYATAGSGRFAPYFGIRRAPYSTSTAINPFTFRHIRQKAELPAGAPLAPSAADMSEVHNVGEIWAEMLFEGYANLLTVGKAAGRSFDESKRRMADYLVAGLRATPVEPTFNEQRDAILGVVWAMAQNDPTRMDDFQALAKGFAKRGLGVGSVSPPATSATLDEAVESSSMQGLVYVHDVSSNDTTKSCDNDGTLDSGESGKLTVRVSNTGWTKLTNTRVKVTTTEAGVTFDNAGLIQIEELAPFAQAEIAVGINIAGGSQSRGLLHINVNATNSDAVLVSTDLPSEVLYNYDDVAAVSASDDVESSHTPWTQTPNTLKVWTRTGDARNHVWHGADIGTSSDESLVSPDIVVRPDIPFVINFSHRYSFEMNPDPAGVSLVPYDGGLLEISEDGGATWRDISTFVDPGYTGTIFAYESMEEPEANALAKRKAWVSASPGYPAYTRVSLDLGEKLAGQTIKLRFRIGTDGGAGAPGWDIDDLSFGSTSFTSISNTPFGALTPNAKPCN